MARPRRCKWTAGVRVGPRPLAEDLLGQKNQLGDAQGLLPLSVEGGLCNIYVGQPCRSEHGGLGNLAEFSQCKRKAVCKEMQRRKKGERKGGAEGGSGWWSLGRGGQGGDGQRALDGRTDGQFTRHAYFLLGGGHQHHAGLDGVESGGRVNNGAVGGRLCSNVSSHSSKRGGRVIPQAGGEPKHTVQGEVGTVRSLRLEGFWGGVFSVGVGWVRGSGLGH